MGNARLYFLLQHKIAGIGWLLYGSGVDWMKPYSPLTFDCENLKFHSIREAD